MGSLLAPCQGLRPCRRPDTASIAFPCLGHPCPIALPHSLARGPTCQSPRYYFLFLKHTWLFHISAIRQGKTRVDSEQQSLWLPLLFVAILGNSLPRTAPLSQGSLPRPTTQGQAAGEKPGTQRAPSEAPGPQQHFHPIQSSEDRTSVLSCTQQSEIICQALWVTLLDRGAPGQTDGLGLS